MSKNRILEGLDNPGNRKSTAALFVTNKGGVFCDALSLKKLMIAKEHVQLPGHCYDNFSLYVCKEKDSTVYQGVKRLLGENILCFDL